MVEMPTQSRGGVKGGTSSLFVCPLWGLGQRPNRSTGDQFKGKSQQRCRQRSVPASNFALPQKRPQAALLTTCPLARPRCWSCRHGMSFLQAENFASAEATRGLCGRPLDPFAFASGCYYVVVFIGRTKGTLTKKPSIKIN